MCVCVCECVCVCALCFCLVSAIDRAVHNGISGKRDRFSPKSVSLLSNSHNILLSPPPFSLPPPTSFAPCCCCFCLFLYYHHYHYYQDLALVLNLNWYSRRSARYSRSAEQKRNCKTRQKHQFTRRPIRN